VSIESIGNGSRPSSPNEVELGTPKSTKRPGNAAPTTEASSTQAIPNVDPGHGGDSDSGVSKASSGFSQYLAAVRSLPSIREERVNALRSSIEQGTYTIPTVALAQRLLGHGDP
jgi:flagellar biosynthesis anti-sigma factor FlgM